MMGKNLSTERHEEIWGIMELFCFFIVEVVILLYVFVNF